MNTLQLYQNLFELSILIFQICLFSPSCRAGTYVLSYNVYSSFHRLYERARLRIFLHSSSLWHILKKFWNHGFEYNDDSHKQKSNEPSRRLEINKAGWVWVYTCKQNSLHHLNLDQRASFWKIMWYHLLINVTWRKSTYWCRFTYLIQYIRWKALHYSSVYAHNSLNVCCVFTQYCHGICTNFWDRTQLQIPKSLFLANLMSLMIFSFSGHRLNVNVLCSLIVNMLII